MSVGSFGNRKPQPTKGSQDRVTFPKNAQEADGWGHIVRLLRLDKENHETYKYCRHSFKAMAGQGPWIDRDNMPQPRDGKQQIAYCLGSPQNPFSQDGAIEMYDDGIAECRSIVLPNGQTLHDVDGGGELRERCLVWSWTNKHVAMLERAPKFFDKLLQWVQKVGSNPFYYGPEAPGFDVIIETVAKGGNFYDYTFSCPPVSPNRNFDDIRHLIKEQRGKVVERMNPAQTKEKIIQNLGLGAAPSRGGADEDDDFGGGAGPTGTTGRLDTGAPGSDALDNLGGDDDL